MSASMKWRHLGHLQLLSRAVALMADMAEMKVSPQEMANPQDMKMFAVERHASWRFRAFSCSVWSAIVATRICAESAACLGSATVVGTRRDSVVQVCVLLSWVLKLDDQTLVHRLYQLTWTSITRTGRNGWVSVEDGGRERLWSGCEPKPISADQMHSTHAG